MTTLLLKLRSSKLWFKILSQYHVIMRNPYPIVLLALIIGVLLVTSYSDTKLRNEAAEMRRHIQALEDKHYGLVEFLLIYDQ